MWRWPTPTRNCGTTLANSLKLRYAKRSKPATPPPTRLRSRTTMPNPDAEAYMAVRALAYGLEQARGELDDRLRALADDLGVRGGFSTSFGDIRDSVSEAK